MSNNHKVKRILMSYNSLANIIHVYTLTPTMSMYSTTNVKEDSIQNTIYYVSPNDSNKKRCYGRDNQVRTVKQPSLLLDKPILSRVLVDTIEDQENDNGLHHVYGFTKHWFDKDHIKLKRNQILSNLKGWRHQNVQLYKDCNDKYLKDTVLDKFYEVLMEETINIEDHVEVFDGIILNALSQEALAHYINRKKDDAVAYFLFNLIHFDKLTLYKAECYMVAFQTVTVFEKDGVVVGELILEAGKKMKWNKHE